MNALCVVLVTRHAAASEPPDARNGARSAITGSGGSASPPLTHMVCCLTCMTLCTIREGATVSKGRPARRRVRGRARCSLRRAPCARNLIQSETMERPPRRFGAERWTRIGAGNRPRDTHTWNPASYPQGGWCTSRKRHVRAPSNGSGMNSGAPPGASRAGSGRA